MRWLKYLIWPNKNDTLVFGFENPRSLAIKCQYILDKDLLGGMYWDYDGDNEQGDLRRTVARKPIEQACDKARVLVLTESAGQHGGFTDAGLRWLVDEGVKGNFSITVINNASFWTKRSCTCRSSVWLFSWTFRLIHGRRRRKMRSSSISDEGRGGWIGFHHATLLGEFDGYPLWQWFSDFMGGVRFRTTLLRLPTVR